jgi:transcriptional regulator GlxA family with amidase domain
VSDRLRAVSGLVPEGVTPDNAAAMLRRDLLQLSAALGLAASLPGSALSQSKAAARAPAAPGNTPPNPLRPPADGIIPVAFLMSADAVVIDFAGPWEVFENVRVAGAVPRPFQPYTVAETTAPIEVSGGMTIVPKYSLASAPPPKVIVIPAQSEPSEAVVAWLRSAARASDLTMSVCTGAYVLAKTGLLSGKAATTHHSAYVDLAMSYPDIKVKRGARFVESGNLASSGGLSSGIDLALRVVERYYGREVALRTADNLEYQGLGWMNADSNQVYAKRRVSTAQRPLCAVCEMDVDVATAPKSTFKSRTYYFCMDAHKQLFDHDPDRFVDV